MVTSLARRTLYDGRDAQPLHPRRELRPRRTRRTACSEQHRRGVVTGLEAEDQTEWRLGRESTRAWRKRDDCRTSGSFTRTAEHTLRSSATGDSSTSEKKFVQVAARAGDDILLVSERLNLENAGVRAGAPAKVVWFRASPKDVLAATERS